LEIDNTKNFVGQDLFKSGRIAASLMKEITLKNATIAIIHIDEDSNNAIYVQEKEKGFRSYFKETGNLNIVTWNCRHDTIEDVLVDSMNENLNLSGIFVTTSKVYKVAEFIKNKKIEHIKIIGYDLLDKNINYLNQNVITFLIHQNPKKQVYLGLTYLVDYFLFDKEIPTKSLLPIDIITAENLETYIEDEPITGI
jgi:LacI family transcriptional regulator